MTKYWKHREAIHTIARFAGLDLETVVANMLKRGRYD
jgi:hypothetical protein